MGSVIKSFLVDTTAGLALRSTDRASPLVILGLAMFLGWRGERPRRPSAQDRAGGRPFRRGRHRRPAATPLWTGAIIADGFTQPARPPPTCARRRPPWITHHPGTRVYALPGNNFAAYRWGDTIDTVYPGLHDPSLRHPRAADHGLAGHRRPSYRRWTRRCRTAPWTGTPSAPMASLMSAGDVLVQYDQAYERYDTPIPQQLAADLAPTPPG